MSHFSRKKREYESKAAEFYEKKDFDNAFFYTHKAAEFGLALAEQSNGKIAKAHVEDAFNLIDTATELRDRVPARDPAKTEKTVAEGVNEQHKKGGKDGREWVVSQKPTIGLDEVKGLVEAKKIVEDALVNPVKHPDIFASLKVKPGTGLLLYGPPGTGKTMFAKAIANELDATFMHVKLNELKSKYVGDSEKNVAMMFSEARSHKRCVLFLDECESVLRKRGSQKIATVEQFLQEADGFQESENQLFILLATNRPWLIDSAVLRSGRISAKAYIGLPDPEAREQIIREALDGVPLDDDVDITQLVAETEGFSGAEIHHHNGGGVCDEAGQNAARRWVLRREGLASAGQTAGEEAGRYCRDDFEEALRKATPTSKLDPVIMEKNRTWSIDDTQKGDPTA